MADIVYCYNDEVYFNLTNKCPCSCTFCIRNNGDSVGGAKTLWFEKEPAMEEIYKAIDGFDFSGYKEAVFCGYGDRKSTRLNSSHTDSSRMPSSA